MSQTEAERRESVSLGSIVAPGPTRRLYSGE